MKRLATLIVLTLALLAPVAPASNATTTSATTASIRVSAPDHVPLNRRFPVVHGRVYNGRGGSIRLQKRIDGRWRTLRRTTKPVSRSGRFVYKRRHTGHGYHMYRVVAKRKGNVIARSRKVRLHAHYIDFTPSLPDVPPPPPPPGVSEASQPSYTAQSHANGAFFCVQRPIPSLWTNPPTGVDVTNRHIAWVIQYWTWTNQGAQVVAYSGPWLNAADRIGAVNGFWYNSRTGQWAQADQQTATPGRWWAAYNYIGISSNGTTIDYFIPHGWSFVNGVQGAYWCNT